MRLIITDGGRAAAGFKGTSNGDRVARAIAIVTGLPYREVHDRLAAETGAQRATPRTAKRGAQQAKASTLAANGSATICRNWDLSKLPLVRIPVPPLPAPA